MSKAAGGGRINIRRNVAASTNLATITGLPLGMRASTVLLMNSHETTAQTVVLDGGDGTDFTITVPIETYIELDGDFASVGAISDAALTVVAGWSDDGTVAKNP